MAETQLLDAGWGLFRCFRVASASADHANITALTSLGGGRGGFYEWGSGPQIAECPSGHHSAEPIDRPDEWVDRPDRIPVLGCGCGFWGFKSYGELLAQEGYDNSLVYALMRMWGMAVEHETGMRTEFAEIIAFIEPVRPEHLRSYPREGLSQSFPDVRIVKPGKLPDVIKDRGLTTLKRAPAPPVLQWLTASGELVWRRDTYGAGSEQAARLPVAAKHSAETISVATHRLSKARFRDDGGQVYVFWQHDDSPVIRAGDFQEFYRMVRDGTAPLIIHQESLASQG